LKVKPRVNPLLIFDKSDVAGVDGTIESSGKTFPSQPSIATLNSS